MLHIGWWGRAGSQNEPVASREINRKRQPQSTATTTANGVSFLFLTKTQELNTYFSVKGVLEDYHQYQNYTPKVEQQGAGSDSDLSLSDDDEAFQRYREQRLKEMEQMQMAKDDQIKSDLVEELDLDTYVKVAEHKGHGKFNKLLLIHICQI